MSFIYFSLKEYLPLTRMLGFFKLEGKAYIPSVTFQNLVFLPLLKRSPLFLNQEKNCLHFDIKTKRNFERLDILYWFHVLQN
jgi:hypothetical protein